MEINEQLAQAISTLIKGVELGQKSGAYDLTSAGHLSQAVFIATENLKVFGNELEDKKQQALQAIPESPNTEPQPQEVPVKKINSKK